MLAAVTLFARRVPDPQHPRDDGRGADPGARAAAGGRRRPRPGASGSSSPRASCSGRPGRCSGGRGRGARGDGRGLAAARRAMSSSTGRPSVTPAIARRRARRRASCSRSSRRSSRPARRRGEPRDALRARSDPTAAVRGRNALARRRRARRRRGGRPGAAALPASLPGRARPARGRVRRPARRRPAHPARSCARWAGSRGCRSRSSSGWRSALARAAIVRDRARTALTVGALVVGLAMVVALGAVAANAREAATAWLAEVVPGDEILTAIAPVPPVGRGRGGRAARRGRRRRARHADRDVRSRVPAAPGSRPTAVVGADLARRRPAHVRRGRPDVGAGRARRRRGRDPAALARGAAGRRLGDTLAVADDRRPVSSSEVAGVVEHSFPGGSGEAVLVGWSDALDRFGVAGCRRHRRPLRAGRAGGRPRAPAVDARPPSGP